jgi:hypothetical protein
MLIPGHGTPQLAAWFNQRARYKLKSALRADIRLPMTAAETTIRDGGHSNPGHGGAPSRVAEKEHPMVRYVAFILVGSAFTIGTVAMVQTHRLASNPAPQAVALHSIR